MAKNVKQYENILEKIIIKFGIEIENREKCTRSNILLKRQKNKHKYY